MKFLLLAAACLALVCLAQSDFLDFKMLYNKEYADEAEEAHRKKVYEENEKRVNEHNELYEKGEVSFKLEINHLSDLDEDEYMNMLLGYNKSLVTDKIAVGTNYVHDGNVPIPKEINWLQKGAVTHVKDQGHCGSCWAFSSTGSLEAHSFLKSGKLVALSEQNLVDCSTTHGNHGCDGGLMVNAFHYIKDNGGIDTEDSYPYKGMKQKCMFNKTNIGAKLKDWINLPTGDEHVLREVVGIYGPVSVAIDASRYTFQHYKEGVYYEKSCSSERLNHAVLVVGYGEEKGNKYWLVKNSWSDKWGNRGYIKMARDKGNHCGIATESSYPTV